MSEDRLRRAMAASGAPARDPSFALRVLERAEIQRFRRAGWRAALLGGGVAGAAAAGLLMLSVWASAHAAPVTDGALSAAALLAIAWLARGLIGRLGGNPG